MEKTTNLFSTDPDVLVPLLKGATVPWGSVNNLPVLDAATDGDHTFVLCLRADSSDTFVTWSIWRNEEGRICASMGHYFSRLSDAVIDLNRRAQRWEDLAQMEKQILKAQGGLA